MSYSPPDPPHKVPADIVSKLDDQSPEVLRHIARFAEELAEHREREARLAENEEDEEVEERPEDLPDDVPSKATITIKEINENRYYYWQWRDGDKIRSKYKGPVNPDE
ncbi:hypothetical protein [Haloprofundus halophilus]|uniref:hypothetical protein n=1 Tax=Haloprofundus halophilus TaxID=2283527 RepID=UPI000E42D3B6|nr:hypothetical protein [Haloprofundus halophilus]